VRTQRLTAARAATACAVMLSLSISSVAHAQDASPGQSPLCQILTPKEIKAALKMKVGAGVGGDTADGRLRGCTWAATDGSGINLTAGYGPGSLDTYMLKSYLDGAPQTIAGDQARLSSTGILGAVEVGDNLFTLTWGTLNPAKGTSLKKLFQLATPRLASLALAPAPTASPTIAPSSAPAPTLDAGLAALFPRAIGGQVVVPEQSDISEFLGFGGDPNDPGLASPMSQVSDILTSQGTALDVATFAGTLVAVEDTGLLVLAMRVPDADMAAIADQIAPLTVTYMSDPVATSGQIAGRNVTWFTDGPDSQGVQRQYMYPANDVLWEIAGPEPLLTEAFQQLPCAADALAVPTADNGFSCGALPLTGAGSSPGAAASPMAVPPTPAGPSAPGVGLDTLFPATLGGAPAEVLLSQGKAAFASYDPAFVSSMNDILVSHGKTIEDLTVANATFVAKGQQWLVSAYQVPGLDASVTASLFDPLIAALYPKAKRAEMTVGGKPVTLLSNGKYSPKGRFTYIYLRDDVMWEVDAVDPDLTQIFTDLP
jgi:hypothetical protein